MDLTVDQKRREMIAVVESTDTAFKEPRSLSILREASDAMIQDIWHRHFSLWWEIKTEVDKAQAKE